MLEKSRLDKEDKEFMDQILAQLPRKKNHCVLFSQIDDQFSYTILYTTLWKAKDFNHKGALIEMILTTRFQKTNIRHNCFTTCSKVQQLQPGVHQQYTTYFTTHKVNLQYCLPPQTSVKCTHTKVNKLIIYSIILTPYLNILRLLLLALLECILSHVT